MNEQDWRQLLRQLLRVLFTKEKATLGGVDAAVRKHVVLTRVRATAEHLPTTVRAIIPNADMTLVNEAVDILREVAAEVFEVNFDPKDFTN